MARFDDGHWVIDIWISAFLLPRNLRHVSSRPAVDYRLHSCSFMLQMTTSPPPTIWTTFVALRIFIWGTTCFWNSVMRQNNLDLIVTGLSIEEPGKIGCSTTAGALSSIVLTLLECGILNRAGPRTLSCSTSCDHSIARLNDARSSQDSTPYIQKT